MDTKINLLTIKASNEERTQAMRRVQEIIFDKMIDECGANGMSLDGQIWNELGVTLSEKIWKLKNERTENVPNV